MKDKIMYLIIGILLGAIITTAIFMITGNNAKGDMPERPDMEMDGNMTGREFKGDGNRIRPNDDTVGAQNTTMQDTNTTSNT